MINSNGGDSARQSDGLRLFDIHSVSCTVFFIHHTEPREGVKHKPGFLTTNSEKGHEGKSIPEKGLRRHDAE
jgi:hypothetical protein